MEQPKPIPGDPVPAPGAPAPCDPKPTRLRGELPGSRAHVLHAPLPYNDVILPP